MTPERRQGERRQMESGEECCAEVVRVGTTLGVYKLIVGAVWALVITLVPLAYYQMDSVKSAIVATQMDVAKLTAMQESLTKQIERIGK